MGRKPCCDKVGLNRGPWTIEEDHMLMTFIIRNGIHCWKTVPKLAGLLRCGKSCRLRWINYLRPDLKRGGFTEIEEDQIIQLHKTLGNRWSKIASHFEGRTDNEIKNHWNTKIKKRLKDSGIDPKSHESIEPNRTKNVPKESSEGQEDEKVENQYDEGSKNVGEKLEQSDVKANELDEHDDLLSNYEIFNGRLELEVLEHWLNDENIELEGQSSSVASRPDSLNSSVSEISPSLSDDLGYNVHEWFDEMDSFLWV